MIRTSYDPEADAFFARFAADGVAVHETREVAPGVNVDIDAQGRVVGIEVLGVTARDADIAATLPAAAE